jgi:hypothetical protein
MTHPAELSCDERKRRGIRRDGQPRATSMPGYARIKQAAKRAEAEERDASGRLRECGHRHTTAGAIHCLLRLTGTGDAR